MGDKKKEHRKKFESYFEENNRVAKEKEVIVLPSGKYKLIVDVYKKDTYQFARGIVKKIKEENVIADIKSGENYFFYYWIRHPNNDEYLICAENRMEYLVINLSKKIVSESFIPEHEKYMQLIWYDIYPSPDKLVIAVFGYIWGYKTEVRFYDFSNPDKVPLKELGKSREWSDVSVIGWEDNNTFVFSTERWRRLSDNKSATDLSMAEIQALDDYPELYPSIRVEEIGKWYRVL